MQCRSIRVKADHAADESGRRVVCITIGNMRQVGCVDEVAWVEMSSGMARSVAADLIEVANSIDTKE